MLRDRGAIKWTAMMLPEHVARLKHDLAETKKTDKPIIDEQQNVLQPASPDQSA
ncbi:hypothetical protein [Bacillus zhangzhouensis]|uniref:hypothetical protein n=1 Tax=Bacillus TaxID=1386 RepID=UPI002EB48A45|nr:hypothetical protein [Bacillus zhangzhouensis]